MLAENIRSSVKACPTELTSLPGSEARPRSEVRPLPEAGSTSGPAAVVRSTTDAKSTAGFWSTADLRSTASVGSTSTDVRSTNVIGVAVAAEGVGAVVGLAEASLPGAGTRAGDELGRD